MRNNTLKHISGVPGKGVIKPLKCHETNQSQLKNTRKLEMLKLDIAMVEVEKVGIKLISFS